MHAIKINCLLFLFSMLSFIPAQSQMLYKNAVGLQAGAGWRHQLQVPGHAIKTPPLTIVVEKGMADNFGAGFSIGYAASEAFFSESPGNTSQAKYHYVWGVARVTNYLRFLSGKKLHVCAGLTVGWGCGFPTAGHGEQSRQDTEAGRVVIGHVLGVFTHCRFRLAGPWWLFGEIGWGGTPLSAGVYMPVRSPR